MARIYLDRQDNPLLNAVTGFQEGRKLRNDELYRQAQMDLEAQKFAEDRYAQVEKTPYGYFDKFVDNAKAMVQDKPYIDKRLGYSANTNKSGAPTPFQGIAAKKVDPKAKIETTPSGSPITTYETTPEEEAAADAEFEALGGRLPQSQPMQEKPLLASQQQEKTYTKDIAGKQMPFKEGAKIPIGNRPQKDLGGGVKAQPVLQMEKFPTALTEVAVSDAQPQPAPQAPAPIPELVDARDPAEFNPSRSLLTRMAEQATTGVNKDVQPQIPIGSLPEGWQRLVLNKKPNEPISPQEQAITIPADIVKAVVEQTYKPQAQGKAPVQFDAALSDAIGKIEAGQPLASVSRQLTIARGGKLPESDMKELRAAIARVDSNKRADKLSGLRQENLEISRTEKAVEKQDRAVERYKKSIDDTGVLAALPFLQQIERETGVVTGTNVDKKKLPGVGTNLARAIPFFGNEIAMAMAKSYKGGATSQALQGLLNAQIRTNSGQAVTKYEEGRNLVQQGMAAGGSEEDVARGIQLMMDGLREAYASAKAAYPKEVVELYESRDGFKGLDQSFKGQRKEKQKPEEKRKESQDSGYQSELQKAKSLMLKYREQVQKEMEAGGLGAAWASRKVSAQKSKVDAYLKEQYGKGYVE